MIRITPAIAIDESELTESFVRASGPGGQNVNKLATAVELRFDAARSPALDVGTLGRLKVLAGRRMSEDGMLIIKSQNFRTQERNRAAALSRLVDLIRRAAIAPKPRHPTKPTL
ncbi:MAG TPA: alternative ribosome rescue aminoacyl-tRNA hydrolase ArfB, partial [Blastocatellia bacterium]|nr:alternative ribosome rescue aminoacyl-tRNA hydrolase ArfB [Blastocatellia bacterium]